MICMYVFTGHAFRSQALNNYIYNHGSLDPRKFLGQESLASREPFPQTTWALSTQGLGRTSISCASSHYSVILRRNRTRRISPCFRGHSVDRKFLQSRRTNQSHSYALLQYPSTNTRDVPCTRTCLLSSRPHSHGRFAYPATVTAQVASSKTLSPAS